MSGTKRHRAIIGLLHQHWGLRVSRLADELGVSEATIRRDLLQLEREGVLRREHGRAVSQLGQTRGIPFRLREIDSAPTKGLLAAAVATTIKDGETVALDSGTTCLAVARELAGRPLTVMPLSVQGIRALNGHRGTELIVPGGSVRQEEGAIVGPLADASIKSVRFDAAVIAPFGAEAKHGFTAFDVQDATTKRHVLDASKRSVFVVEGAAFSRLGHAAICPMSAIDILVTDSGAPVEILSSLRSEGVEVIVA
ncbi:DeoR/GlpR family DNA-binding transcription regulator [Paenarthrobacter sp. NPDC092416]|uniref:DeoR/GlpR family DNA-binding transcription regulator n=1 Tax=Paenarthrobacter sp. NPDC092416 TaxID=3364386 RepID=UPI0037FCB07E